MFGHRRAFFVMSAILQSTCADPTNVQDESRRWDVGDLPPYSPSGAILGSQLGAERTATRADPGPQVRLARWRQSAMNLAAISDVVADQHTRNLNAYVNRYIPYRTLDLAAGSVEGIQPSRFPTNVLRLLEAVEFENIVYNRYYLASNAVEEAEDVLHLTGELVAVLRRDLLEAADR